MSYAKLLSDKGPVRLGGRLGTYSPTDDGAVSTPLEIKPLSLGSPGFREDVESGFQLGRQPW